MYNILYMYMWKNEIKNKITCSRPEYIDDCERAQ